MTNLTTARFYDGPTAHTMEVPAEMVIAMRDIERMFGAQIWSYDDTSSRATAESHTRVRFFVDERGHATARPIE